MNLRNHWLQYLFPVVVSCFLFFSTASLHAQLNANNLTQFTELDGVPGSQVNKIIVDRFGYIWIGTINGLARFDGYEFKRYFSNPNDTTSIQGLVVWSLFEDHKGRIWVASAPGFLNLYNPVTQSFLQYDFKNLIPNPANLETNITAITEDNQGRMYFGVTTNYGERISNALLYLDEKDNQIRKYSGPDSLQIQNVTGITGDQDGNIFFLSYSGLFKIDSSRKLNRINTPAEDLLRKNNEFPTDIKCDKNGYLWLVTSRAALYHINPRDGSFKFFIPPGVTAANFNFNRIVFDDKNGIWMGTDKGILKFNIPTSGFEGFINESKKQLEKENINDLAIDSFGTLWIGTAYQGLLKYEERAVFKSYSFNKEDKNSISAGWASNICETRDGNIWITTSAGLKSGINELDVQTNKINSILLNSILPGSYNVNALFEDTPGEILMNTNTGNYRFFTKNKSVKRITLKGVADSILIRQFFKDSKGNLWLCSYQGLFKKEKNSDLFRRYDLSKLPGSNAGSNEITGAVESKKHGLWLITNNGLFLYNYGTDTISRHGFDKSRGDIFITQDINSFYEDTAGVAWVGTWQGGLSRYNVETKKIRTYTRNEGLPSMSIQGILADEKGSTLWLSTFEGLSKLDMKTDQFNNYSIVDGIQSQLFADGSIVKTSGGLFVFGGSNGITIFNPDQLNKTSIPPKVFLTDFKLFDKSVFPGKNSILKDPIYDTKEIALQYNQNNISLEFLAIHYANPSKNKYAYKLENYDNDWREVGTQHVAFYSNLPPGKYLFRVKAANNSGVWNEEGIALSIIINPPWWKTTGAYIGYGLLFITGLFGMDRYFRSRLVRKEREKNRLRELEQAREIEKAYKTLEQTHETLKATQSQLIQSEKMASLGELTAGIAHEIQNPLNFINNFSEVNEELLSEMKGEIDQGNMDEAKAIANDAIENQKKILHHGKRADAIVKGMLQHSRSSSGVKEPTDINALADEYLRLAYHGLRAKDKSFNATMKTDFDNSVGNINIIPQDIGRVILNLITNAFYAVDKKKKEQSNGYEPTVTVGTKNSVNQILISVKDNGSGIPQKVLDKIFQPFFTTKPTGQGTGLGLSLSYDIVKAHGGEIKVDTKENEGTTFTIALPV